MNTKEKISSGDREFFTSQMSEFESHINLYHSDLDKTLSLFILDWNQKINKATTTFLALDYQNYVTTFLKEIYQDVQNHYSSCFYLYNSLEDSFIIDSKIKKRFEQFENKIVECRDILIEKMKQHETINYVFVPDGFEQESKHNKEFIEKRASFSFQ